MKQSSTPSASRARNWRVRSMVGVVIVLSLAGWWMFVRLRDPARASRPFRVGYQNAPPYQYVAANGSPAGPAIEIFTEAARRRHIPIEWIASPDGPEPNLRSGKVDLWPSSATCRSEEKFYTFPIPGSLSVFGWSLWNPVG